MATLEYNITGTSNGLSAAVRSATTNLNALERSANSTNAALRNDITSLNQLQDTLKRLNRERLTIVDSAQLATQNRRIQELEAEIVRATNAGRIGFDQLGNAIGRSTSGLASMGVGLTRGLGYLRTIAYIIPGLGIAGIFNLAFEGITAAASALNLFNTTSEKTAKQLKEISDAENAKFGKDGFVDSAVALSNLTEKVRLARAGFLDKKGVLKEYNETLGQTIGQVNSLGDAEQKIIDKAPDYLKFLLLKAKAEYAFRKAAEDSYNASVQQDKLDTGKGTPNAPASKFFGGGKINLADTIKQNGIIPLSDFLNQANKTGIGVTDNINKINFAQKNLGLAAQLAGKQQLDALTKVETQSQKTAKKAFDTFEQFAKDNGFKTFNIKPDNQTAAKSKGKTEQDLEQEAVDKRLTEVQRVANEIQRINDKYGIKSTESKEKELAELDAFYNAEVAKAAGNEAILIGLREGRLPAIQAINDKYFAIEQDLYAKIALLEDESTASSGNKIEKQSDRITIEFAKRKKAVNDYYEALKKISGTNIGAINLKQAQTNTQFNQDEKDAQTRLKNKPIEDALKQVTSGFIRDLSDGLFNVSSKAGADFKSVFSGITTSLASTIENIVVSGLSKSLTEGIDIGLKGLSSKLQGIVAGLAIAGGLVSGLTPKTSAVGQGIGGALSGAATGIAGAVGVGAALGTAVGPAGIVAGAVIGGIVGLVGGLFSASKAQKELEQKQLDEQKRQTELLRQNIAYTSSIIGRMTANGVITNIEVGSKGQLVATISGSDIQFVLDRNSKTR